MTAGDEMSVAVKTALADPTKSVFAYAGMDYYCIEESRAKQIKACQAFRDRAWRVHACAFSMLHYEADFFISATLNASKQEEARQKKEYDAWKAYKQKYGPVFE